MSTNLAQLIAHGFAKLTGAQRQAGATQPLAATASNTVVLPSGDQLTKDHVGLPSADNTSDLDKPISTATQAALDTKIGSTFSGDLTAIGTSPRIRGDFSNGTIANRLMFQTSTVNNNTNIWAIPNGTATTANYTVSNSADPSNAAFAQMVATSTDARFMSGITGSGTYLPMTFYTGGSERMRIDTSGNLTLSAGVFGYGSGSGGTVTQATSKSTAVTLNKPSGQITMHNAVLAAGAQVVFVVNCSHVAFSDAVIVNISGGVSSFTNYRAQAFIQGAGQFVIGIENKTGGSLSEAVVINFAVIKGATT